MFETFAVLSTLSCIVIFVALFMIDRAGRRDTPDSGDQGGRS